MSENRRAALRVRTGLLVCALAVVMALGGAVVALGYALAGAFIVVVAALVILWVVFGFLRKLRQARQ